ncbi:MAG: 3-phosphoserine/phosphohydroxythreonine transaminase [Planctomycetota bacterium]
MTRYDTPRIYNFSAGPCTLPLEVIHQAADELPNYQNNGASLIEMSHRSKQVVGVFEQATALVREVLAVPGDMHVLFLSGGATFQFGMIPMNLLHGGKTADYVHSGAWSKKAIADAKAVGNVNLVYDGSDDRFMTLPDASTLKASDDAVYMHVCSNETIGGVQFDTYPDIDVPLVADMSSEITSRPIDYDKFGLIYAGAQKNIGPAGVALVLIKQEMVELANETTSGGLINYLNYANHVKGESMLNTPPVFQVYMIKLVMDWLKAKGGVAWAQQQAETRSKILYDAVERNGGFYKCPVDARYRSKMNVVFTTQNEELDAAFVKEAGEQGISGLKGHRSVGGCRASIYNAMPIEGSEALASFMDTFAAKNG